MLLLPEHTRTQITVNLKTLQGPKYTGGCKCVFKDRELRCHEIKTRDQRRRSDGGKREEKWEIKGRERAIQIESEMDKGGMKWDKSQSRER